MVDLKCKEEGCGVSFPYFQEKIDWLGCPLAVRHTRLLQMLPVFKTAGILPNLLKIPFQFLAFKFLQFLIPVKFLLLVTDSALGALQMRKNKLKTIMVRGCELPFVPLAFPTRVLREPTRYFEFVVMIYQLLCALGSSIFKLTLLAQQCEVCCSIKVTTCYYYSSTG
jgi:hypothetical protein